MRRVGLQGGVDREYYAVYNRGVRFLAKARPFWRRMVPMQIEIAKNDQAPLFGVCFFISPLVGLLSSLSPLFVRLADYPLRPA